MNREILFRGKRIDDREWVEGFLFSTSEHTYIAYQNQFDDDLFLSPKEIFVETEPSTVCQYTGLTDQEGRKIFEGDIIKNEYEYIGIVKWECCSFVLDWISWNASRDLYVWRNSVEVIGNIFDNPELIKQ